MTIDASLPDLVEIDDETAISGATNALILARANLAQALRDAGRTYDEANRYIADLDRMLQEHAAEHRSDAAVARARAELTEFNQFMERAGTVA